MEGQSKRTKRSIGGKEKGKRGVPGPDKKTPVISGQTELHTDENVVYHFLKDKVGEHQTLDKKFLKLEDRLGLPLLSFADQPQESHYSTFRIRVKKVNRRKSRISLHPLSFQEAVADLLKVKPLKRRDRLDVLEEAVNRLEGKPEKKRKRARKG